MIDESTVDGEDRPPTLAEDALAAYREFDRRRNEVRRQAEERRAREQAEIRDRTWERMRPAVDQAVGEREWVIVAVVPSRLDNSTPNLVIHPQGEPDVALYVQEMRNTVPGPQTSVRITLADKTEEGTWVPGHRVDNLVALGQALAESLSRQHGSTAER